ncbi:hypothetical protein J6590_083975, partial [Homalodisca vitripennis]
MEYILHLGFKTRRNKDIEDWHRFVGTNKLFNDSSSKKSLQLTKQGTGTSNDDTRLGAMTSDALRPPLGPPITRS